MFIENFWQENKWTLLCSCLGDLISQHVSDPAIMMKRKQVLEFMLEQEPNFFAYLSINKNLYQ